MCTHLVYQPKKDAFVSWCDEHPVYATQSDAERHLVTGEKVYQFLVDEMLGRRFKSSEMSYNTIESYVAALVSLFKEQRDQGINMNNHPRENSDLKCLLAERRQKMMAAKSQQPVPTSTGKRAHGVIAVLDPSTMELSAGEVSPVGTPTSTATMDPAHASGNASATMAGSSLWPGNTFLHRSASAASADDALMTPAMIQHLLKQQEKILQKMARIENGVQTMAEVFRSLCGFMEHAINSGALQVVPSFNMSAFGEDRQQEAGDNAAGAARANNASAAAAADEEDEEEEEEEEEETATTATTSRTTKSSRHKRPRRQ